MVKGLSWFRFAWTVLLVVATSAPYLWNWLSTPAGFHYTWILPPYPDDSFGYAAWAQQAAHGAWLFKIKYTALPHSAFFFHPFFLICGWMSALFSCDIGIVFWVVKALGVVLFLRVFYRYIDYLGFGTVSSIASSVLVGVSSGFGGIIGFMGWTKPPSIVPADLWMPEVSTYWSLLWNPLFPFSLTLLLLSIYWLDRGTRDGRAADLWRGGLAAGVMVLIHPYSAPFLFAFPTIVTIARQGRRSVGYLSRYIIASLPFLIYLVWTSRSNRVVSQHSVLGEMKSPTVIAYLLGFGLPLVLAATALFVKKGALVRRYWHIFLWFLLSAMLAYFPFWFQRKLIFGAHIALCILAGAALDLMLSKLSSVRSRRYVLIALVIIFTPLLVATPIYLFRNEREEVKLNKEGAYYVSDDLMEGFQVLRDRSKPDDVVMATYPTSRLIAAFAGNTVVWGHWAMSIDLKERQKWIRDLFDPGSDWSDEKRRAAFWANDIQFIFADGILKESLARYPFGWGVVLRDAPKIFANNSVIIYQRPSNL